MPGQLVFLATTHRVAPGLLSWRAWRELGEGEVHAASLDHPQVPYLAEAGVAVHPAPESLSWSSGSAGELARLLVERAREAGPPVVWLAAMDGDEDLMRALGELVTIDPDGAPEVEVVHGSYDLPGARLLDLVTTMDQLRRHCPWDRDQTHRTLAPYLLEEAYETVEAIETDDRDALREELGDVLLQVMFHSRIAEESDDETHFSVDDVAADIVDKLIRRHPHVFGDVQVSGAEEVKTNWEAIKQAEKQRASVVEGIPLGQPALALAHALQRRAARAGMPADLIASFAEDGIGGELFAVVARAREQGIDPEAALRHVAREFRDRLLDIEESSHAEGCDPSDLGPDDWRQRWHNA